MYRYALFAAPLLMAAPLRAADPLPDADATAARAAVVASLDAARKGDWTAYARGFRADSVKAFHDAMRPTLEAAVKQNQPEAVLPLFPGAKDVKAVLAYTPEEFLAGLMKGATATQKGEPGAETATVLGLVAEGPAQAHAVVRVTRRWLGVDKTTVEVLTVRKVGGDWKLDLPRELELLGAALRATRNVATATATAEDKAEPDPAPKK